MENELAIEEELEIEERISEPFSNYFSGSLSEKKRVSLSIFQRKENEILLVNNYGFTIDFIFSGLTEKHIEHIANNAPKDYKENIMKILQDQEMMKGVFEIAKAMDEDLGRGATQNQDRVRNVIQYIKDNRVAFQF